MSAEASRMSRHEMLFWLATAVYVAVLPLSSTIALRYLAFAGMLAATAVAIARRELPLRFPAAAAWVLYAAIALLSLAWAVDVPYSFGQIRSEIGFAALVFVMAASWIDGIDRLRRLAWIVAACDAFMVGYSGYLIAITPHAGTELIGSYRAATGTYSTYLVTVAPLLLFLFWDARRTNRRAMATGVALLLAANVAALWFTANRQGVLVCSVEIAIVGALELRAAFDRRKLAVLVVAAAAVAALFVAQYQKRHGQDDWPVESREVNTVGGDPRWELWRFTVGEIAKQPWHGAGFGRETFLKVYGDFRRSHLSLLWHAHNMVLNKGIQMGIPGMLAFLMLWLAVAAAVRRAACRGDAALAACAAALLAGVFLKNMTDDFFVQDNALMFWLLLGALLGALRQPRPDGGP